MVTDSMVTFSLVLPELDPHGVDGGHRVEAGHHLAEQRVAGGQAHAVGARDDEELAAVGVGPGVGHGQRPELVASRRGELVGELVARAPGAGPGGVTALEHEAGDDAVEDDAVEVVVAGQEHEAVHRARRRRGSRAMVIVPLEVTMVAV